MVFNILPTLSIDNFHAKFFVTLKSDPDPDTHWFGALDPDPHCDKNLDPDMDPHLNQCGSATLPEPDHIHLCAGLQRVEL